MDLGLKGKVAIVAGASRGLGKAMARSLASEGCRLVLCARGEEQLMATANELSEEGASFLAVPMDITRADAGTELVQAAMDTYGRLDILVGNAGGNRRMPLEKTTDTDWEEIFRKMWPERGFDKAELRTKISRLLKLLRSFPLLK